MVLSGMIDYFYAAQDALLALRPGEIRDLIVAKIGNGAGPRHFYGMRMNGLPKSRWSTFVSANVSDAFYEIVNLETGKCFFRNKRLCLKVLAENRIPHTPILTPEDASKLASEELFVKPDDGHGGSGAFTIRADDPALPQRTRDQIVQRRFRSHPSLAPIGGNFGLGTLRVHTVLTPNGGKVVDVILKVLGGPSLVDNFTRGAKGNLIAHVDIETGKLTHAFGRRPRQNFRLERFQSHPALGTLFEGFELPDFIEMLETAEKMAECFPEAPIMGSDVALTDDGPLVVEPNLMPDMTLPQITRGIGARQWMPGWMEMSILESDRKKRAERRLFWRNY